MWIASITVFIASAQHFERNIFEKFFLKKMRMPRAVAAAMAAAATVAVRGAAVTAAVRVAAKAAVRAANDPFPTLSL